MERGGSEKIGVQIGAITERATIRRWQGDEDRLGIHVGGGMGIIEGQRRMEASVR